MATRADGTLPRAGKPATDAAKEAHAILVTAERGLTDSLAKPKVSNAKSLTGAFRSVTLRDGTDPSVASAFAAFGEGAAEVRRLGDDGPGGKGVIRRLEGLEAMKQSRKERHQSAVEAWEKERDRVVDEELAGEAAALVKAFREKIDASDAKIAAIMDPFAPDVVRGEHVSTLRTETEEALSDETKAEEDEERAAAEPTEDADPAAAAAAAEAAAARARRAERDAAADAVLSEMDAFELRDAWYTVSVEFPARTHGIDTLESALTEASSRCSSRLAATFSKVVDALLAVAHLPRSEVERYALEETSKLNRSFLDDKRATTELARRLRAREVLGESARRDAWVAATKRWRELRVEKAVDEFDAFLKNERVSNPPAVQKAYEALAADQRAAHTALATHVAKMTNAFRAVVDDENPPGANRSSFANVTTSAVSIAPDLRSTPRVTHSSPFPSLEAVVRWREGMDTRLDAWDAAAAEDVRALEDATRDVDEDVAAALKRAAAAVAAARDAEFEVFDFEFERVRQAEEAAKAEARERSSSPEESSGEKEGTTASGGDGEEEDDPTTAAAKSEEPVPPWRAESLLDELCAPKAAAVAASARAAETRARDAASDRASAWRAEAGRLGAFLEDAARLRETHRFLAERSAADAEAALASLREAFARSDGEREAVFEAARESVARTQTEPALAAAESRAISALEEIEAGYRSFWHDATDVADAFPARVRSHFDAYERRVCRLLRLVPNARRARVDAVGDERDAADGDGAGDGDIDGGADETEAETEADAGNEAKPEGGEKNDERDPALVAWDAEDALEEWTLEDERNEKNAEVADAEPRGGGDDDAPSDSAEPAEVEPADAADDASSQAGELKPPPRERVATRGGASFAVWSDLVDFVANGSRPGPDDAGETEPADGPETSSNVGIPGGFDPYLALGKEDVAAPLLLSLRDALLDDYETHLEASLRRADARSYDEAEFAREELESRLMAHRPRYGALDLGDVGKRRAALRERRAAFERYLLSAARAAKLADERFATSLEETEKISKTRVLAVGDVERRLSATASAAALVIREKECARAVSAARDELESAFAALRERAERNCEHVISQTANFRFTQGLPKAAAPPPEELDGPGEGAEGEGAEGETPEAPAAGDDAPSTPPDAETPADEGDEASREAEASSPDGSGDASTDAAAPDPGDDRFARLAAVDAAARKSLADNRAQIAELRERCLAALAEAERAFQEAVPHHKEDLALLDVVRVACDKAAFAAAKVSEEDARLKASLEATAAYFGKVAMGRSKARDPVTHDRETTAEKVLETLASFRVALLKRCLALEIVDPATAPDHASVAIELDDPERTTAPAADRASRNEEGISSGDADVSNDGAPGEAEEGEVAEARKKEETVSADSARVSAAVETARAAIAAAGDAYFAAKNPERPSTRPDSVPESEGGAEALVKTKRAFFDALEQDASKRRDAEAAELRFFVAGIGETLGKALETTLKRELETGLGFVAEAARAAAAETASFARDVSSRRSEHKDRMRPGIAHPGRKLELAALLASERTRAEDAARVIENESRNVTFATRTSAAKWARRFRRATRLAATLAGGVVVPEDVCVDGPGAEMEQAARRKNLKQLRVERLKRQNAADAERRDDSKRANVKLRSWAHLDVADTTPESAPGHEPFDVAKALPPLAPLEKATHGSESDGKSGAEAPDAGADEEAPATDDANGDEENVAEEADPDASPVWAADVPSVRVLMDARDVTWRDFTAACRDAYARHAAATARRVADEVAHRQVWDELVARAREGRAR